MDYPWPMHALHCIHARAKPNCLVQPPGQQSLRNRRRWWPMLLRRKFVNPKVPCVRSPLLAMNEKRVRCAIVAFRTSA